MTTNNHPAHGPVSLDRLHTSYTARRASQSGTSSTRTTGARSTRRINRLPAAVTRCHRRSLKRWCVLICRNYANRNK